MTSDREQSYGLTLGLCAYAIWGFFPLFFKQLQGVVPIEIISHRIFWSFIFLLVLVGFLGRLRETAKTFTNKKIILSLALSTLLIATNWLVFIYAVSIGAVLQSSLGYFLTPLVNVLLGYLFFQERLTRVQILSLTCAVIGVGVLAASLQEFPWIALTLAGTFGTYGLIRKRAKIDSLIGLTVETSLLAPIAGGYLLILGSEGVGAFGSQSIGLSTYLILSGVVTAIPLILFVGAAKRLRLSTIGFLQFITPTMHFLLAVLLFGEDFNLPHAICFSLIWVGLIIYTIDAFRRHGRVRSRGVVVASKE